MENSLALFPANLHFSCGSFHFSFFSLLSNFFQLSRSSFIPTEAELVAQAFFVCVFFLGFSPSLRLVSSSDEHFLCCFGSASFRCRFLAIFLHDEKVKNGQFSEDKCFTYLPLFLNIQRDIDDIYRVETEKKKCINCVFRLVLFQSSNSVLRTENNVYRFYFY